MTATSTKPSSSPTIAEVTAGVRRTFERGVTRPIEWRCDQLDAMATMLRDGTYNHRGTARGSRQNSARFGPSGMGAYHGQAGFEALRHLKSVFDRPVKPDFSLLYPPYTKLKQWLLRRR